MKRKGFTLIELLAVILVLGIIALIAIPSVNKIIEEIKKEAFAISSNNLVRAVENNCQIEMLDNKKITKMYTFTDGTSSPKLDVKGQLPTNGYALVDSTCKVTLSVTNGKLTANKIVSAERVTVVKGNEIEEIPIVYNVYDNGTAIYFNPETGNTCLAGEAVSTTGTKTGCMKWYTFNDEGSTASTINLILDHNTTALVAWNSTGSNVNGPTNVLDRLKADTSSWAGVPTRTDSYSLNNGTADYTIDYDTYKAKLITISDIAKITGNNSFVEETSIATEWFFLDSNNQTRTITTKGASHYAWLFDYTRGLTTGCEDWGCNIQDFSNFGYWTATSISGLDSFAWGIFGHGGVYYFETGVADYYGVRPVITIDKSVIDNL